VGEQNNFKVMIILINNKS